MISISYVLVAALAVLTAVPDVCVLGERASNPGEMCRFDAAGQTFDYRRMYRTERSAEDSFNLQEAAYSVVIGGGGAREFFFFQICGTLVNRCSVPPDPLKASVMIYQSFNAAGADGEQLEQPDCFFAPLSNWDQQPKEVKPIESADPSAGLELVYSNAQDPSGVCGGEPVSLTYRLRCGEFKSEKESIVIGTAMMCNIVIEITHPGACPVPPEDAGLSKGSLLLIILLVVTLVYLAAGAAYKWRAGVRGVEMIPNIDFWRKLPSLAADGCRFTYSKARGAAAGGGGGGGESKPTPEAGAGAGYQNI